ncbi:MAG: sulfatase [Cyclobacteriaceae bacterium]|uniref:sulfatase family protein n=1 Tax=Reichenbachiella sp. TaxID=2184521 RepID=UPI003265750F
MNTIRIFILASICFKAGMLLAGTGVNNDKTNFIIIIGDDISIDDFGAYGHPKINTPHIDKIAKKGMRFNNAYLTTSSCSPSRASIITSRYPHNTGAPELHMPLPGDQTSIAQLLKEQGFYTLAAGKWHLGKEAKKGFHKVLDSRPGGEELWVKSLEERPTDKPFFMWFAAHDAHRGWQDYSKAKPHAPEDAVIPPYMIDTDSVRADMARYYDEIQRFDRYIGQVFKELNRQNILENTVVIIMADNGRPFPRSKTRLYDSGIKTPFIVHWPSRITSGNVVSESLISVIDIGPTVLEIAGIDKPSSFQGRSFSTLLTNSEESICEYVFAEHNWHVQTAHERMVRSGDFVYIRNAYPWLPQICGIDFQNPQQELKKMAAQGLLTEAQNDPLLEPRLPEELYDVKNDPYQIHNIAQDLAYRDILNSLRKIMDEWQSSTGDSTPTFENATPDRINRWTGESINGLDFAHVPGGEIPGAVNKADAINDPGPR